MDFKNIWILLVIPFVIGIVYVSHRRRKATGFQFPSSGLVAGLPVGWKVRFAFVPFLLRLIALVLFIIALAGPRKIQQETQRTAEGIDIVMALDTSGSMRAEDFELKGKRVNSLDIVKHVVSEFIPQRPYDQISLIAYAGAAYVVCPLTTDTQWLLDNLERIQLGVIEDSTAIGSAIASSVTRLQNSQAKSKVIVLLTDGINTAGSINPLDAAKAAQALGIKIYTIGAGSEGVAPIPFKNAFGRIFYLKERVDIDEDMLREVARITGGQYFRATDTAKLEAIYKENDQMEKTEFEEVGYFEYEELFGRFLLPALALLVVEIILTNTVFLRIP